MGLSPQAINKEIEYSYYDWKIKKAFSAPYLTDRGLFTIRHETFSRYRDSGTSLSIPAKSESLTQNRASSQSREALDQ